MSEVYEKLMKCYKNIREITDFEPKVAIVLGSGLGSYGSEIQIVKSVPYSDIDGFPVSTVVGHQGQYLFGYVGDVPVVCMQGRVHFYEGYPVTDVVLPIRIMGLLGAKYLFLSNASGGINSNMNAGDFMMITDHVSVFAPNPLIGSNIDKLGVRFPDMSYVYNKDIQNIIIESANDLNIPLKQGVYAQLTGPSFESPAEIKMLAKLGVDAVGMSTVCEAIAANHMGMTVCGISCVCNMAAGISANPLTHEEVQAAAKEAEPKFKQLVTEVVKRIGEL